MKIAPHLARIRAGGYDNAGDPAGYAIARAYDAFRMRGRPATDALRLARQYAWAGHPIAENPREYSASYQNAPGDRGGRWIENPAAAGLRFVGFADEIAGQSINHRGWYTDEFGDGAVERGAVYQLPARGGRPVYVEAIRIGETRRNGDWQDQSGDGAALVFLGNRHIGERGGTDYCPGRRWIGDYADSTMRAAARGADREAEISAEKEREYSAAWSAGNRAADLETEARGAKEAARELLREMRRLRAILVPDMAPAACKALRVTVRRHLSQWKEDRERAAELREQWGNSEAFADAYGESV